MRAEDFAQRRVHEVGRGVIALDIAPPRFIDLGNGHRRLERLAERTDDRALAIYFLDIFDRELPSVAFHHTRVTDLTAGFGVEWILLENQLELITGLAKGNWLGLGFGCLVSNPFLPTLCLNVHPSTQLADDALYLPNFSRSS